MNFISETYHNLVDAYKIYPTECKEIYNAFKKEGLEAFDTHYKVIQSVAKKTFGAIAIAIGSATVISAVICGTSVGGAILGVAFGVLYMGLGHDLAIMGRNCKEEENKFVDPCKDTIIMKPIRNVVVYPIVDCIS